MANKTVCLENIAELYFVSLQNIYKLLRIIQSLSYNLFISVLIYCDYISIDMGVCNWFTCLVQLPHTLRGMHPSTMTRVINKLSQYGQECLRKWHFHAFDTFRRSSCWRWSGTLSIESSAIWILRHLPERIDQMCPQWNSDCLKCPAALLHTATDAICI